MIIITYVNVLYPKNIAVKSLMVNPNTNIRDYGIPQNYNIKRKQIYTDYFEIDLSSYHYPKNYYMPIAMFLT